MRHPIQELRAFIADEFAEDLPLGVSPVTEWCAEPQFFPGASGLVSLPAWDLVVPGELGFTEELPGPSLGGVLVLGNYQATLSSYRRILSGELGGFPTTWRNLRLLLRDVDPREVFLTNAFIGLPDLKKDTEPFPLTSTFLNRCHRLLELETELFKPRCIICLGVPPAKFLARTFPELREWNPWPGYAALDAKGSRIVRGVAYGSNLMTCVAVRHPSAIISSIERRNDSALIVSALTLVRS
ncbi:MAG TPA: uracil-DNA glycosylase family protein [Acidimicrobiales bacterium]|nr:uracil-DNA glycosylase family protein [Acidimicrobiales bacterium]